MPDLAATDVVAARHHVRKVRDDELMRVWIKPWQPHDINEEKDRCGGKTGKW